MHTRPSTRPAPPRPVLPVPFRATAPRTTAAVLCRPARADASRPREPCEPPSRAPPRAALRATAPCSVLPQPSCAAPPVLTRPGPAPRESLSPARPRAPRLASRSPARPRPSRPARARQMVRGACLVPRRARLGKPCWRAAWRDLVTRARDPGAALEGLGSMPASERWRAVRARSLASAAAAPRQRATAKRSRASQVVRAISRNTMTRSIEADVTN
jgi:hypothetical protein